MFGSPILETALGLTLVFLLFSMLVSAFNEIIFGQMTHRRAKLLEMGLKLVLSGKTAKTDAMARKKAAAFLDETVKKASAQTPSSADVEEKKAADKAKVLLSAAADQPTFAEQVLGHPLILSLSANNQKPPSYIPPRVFSDAVLGVLLRPKFAANSTYVAMMEDLGPAVAALPDGDEAKEILRALLLGRSNITGARERIERWFDDAVERISGTYRRKTQFWLYIWATVFTVLLNVDTLEITKRLLVDASLRGALGRSAEAAATNAYYRAVSLPQTNITVVTNRAVLAGPPAVTNVVLSTNFTILSTNALGVADRLAGDIAGRRLPIGWTVTSTNTNWLARAVRCLTSAPTNDVPTVPGLITLATVSNSPPLPQTLPEWLLKVLGLFLTVCAISQGAPFWFDMLNRVTNLRAAGPKPPPATPSAPKP